MVANVPADRPRHSTPTALQDLLNALDAGRPLAERLDALEDVARWVLAVPALKRLRPIPYQLSRLRLLIDTVTAAPELRQKLSATLGSVLRDTSAVHLFAEAGLPSDRGLAVETIDRISRRLLPQPPDDENLERFVSRVFRRAGDCAWIEAAPIELFVDLGEALGDIWEPIRNGMADAIALLCTRVSALGLSESLRERGDPMAVRDSPFFRLPRAPLEQIPDVIAECRVQLDVIHRRLETTGVSVDVVYCVDAIRHMSIRIERMTAMLRPDAEGASGRVGKARMFLERLTAGRIADTRLRTLAASNLGLLARKVIERVGHSGEHYVTTTRREYWRMMASAAGGGALTALTVIGKFLAKWQHLAPFIDGMLASANYACSFLAMQFLGFTLATKQPSMTAAALAATIRDTQGAHQLDDLVDLIARITRSQFAAACGNVLAVIPVAIAIDAIYTATTGQHFLTAQAAQATVASFHPWNTGTIAFAALTGVLLWMSSLGAGWLENWVTYRRLPDALAENRVGARLVGRTTMIRVANFVRNQSAGIGGNVTLGILLGMTPVIGSFFGLPLDVRHITLSAGSLAFAGSALGPGAITVAACGGIAAIGLMNFGVSFVLALAVALRAREVTQRERLGLATTLLLRFLRRPWQFFLPPSGRM